MPEEFRRHEACSLFHWTDAEYDLANAHMVDWAFAFEGVKKRVRNREDDSGL